MLSSFGVITLSLLSTSIRRELRSASCDSFVSIAVPSGYSLILAEVVPPDDVGAVQVLFTQGDLVVSKQELLR